MNTFDIMCCKISRKRRPLRRPSIAKKAVRSQTPRSETKKQFQCDSSIYYSPQNPATTRKEIRGYYPEIPHLLVHAVVLCDQEPHRHRRRRRSRSRCSRRSGARRVRRGRCRPVRRPLPCAAAQLTEMAVQGSRPRRAAVFIAPARAGS